MALDEKDLIFDQEIDPEYSPGDTILANNEEFTVRGFVKAKSVTDNLGFPANYFWYKAENEAGEVVNIFMFDNDIDSVESNDQVAEKWFNSVYNSSENL